MNAVVTWSTRKVGPAKVADYWCSKTPEGLQVNIPQPDEFEASLQYCSAGNVSLSLVSATRQHIVQPRKTSRSSGRDFFDLIFLSRGQLTVRHYTQLTTLHPGDCVLMDESEEGEVITGEPSKSLIIRVPKALMNTWVAQPAQIAGRALTASIPRARPLLAHFSLITDEYSSASGGIDVSMVDPIAPLLAVAATVFPFRGSQHARKLVLRLKQQICDNFFDPDFTLSTAASQFGISRRYLVALFANEQTTFGDTLMRIRLERTATMLRDARFESLSILDVALRCGFRDASHFSKRFRDKYNLTPATFRLSSSVQQSE